MRISALLFAPILALGAAASPGPNLVSKVEVQNEGGALVVAIHGSRPPNFTTFSMVDPPRFVIDLSESAFKGVPEDMRVRDGTIDVVKNLGYGGGDAPSMARVVIAFERDVDPPELEAAGTTLLVRIAKPPAARTPVASDEAAPHAAPATAAAAAAAAVTVAAKPAGDAQDAEAKARAAEAEALAKAEAERKAKADAEAKARAAQAEALAKAEAERKAKAEAEAKARAAEAEALAKAEAERKAKAEAEVRARAQAEAERVAAEREREARAKAAALAQAEEQERQARENEEARAWKAARDTERLGAAREEKTTVTRLSPAATASGPAAPVVDPGAAAAAQARADAERANAERAEAERARARAAQEAQAAAERKAEAEREERARSAAEAKALEQARQEEIAAERAKAEQARQAEARAARALAERDDAARRAAEEASRAEAKQAQAAKAAAEREAAERARAEESARVAAAKEQEQREAAAREAKERAKADQEAAARPAKSADEAPRADVSPAEQPSPKLGRGAAARPRRQHIREVGFKVLADVSRVYVRLSDSPRFQIVEAGEKLIRVELPNASVTRRNDARFLDTTYFPGAVATVTPRREGRSTVLEIALKERVAYRQRVEGDLLTIDFERPVAAKPSAAAPVLPASN